MNKSAVAFALLSTAMLQVATAAGTTVTWTGTVTEADGGYSSVPIGSFVTGTYSFDYSAAIPSQSAGTVGSASPWTAASDTGDGNPAPYFPAGPLVFTSTASIINPITNQVIASYSSQSPSAFSNGSEVSGSNGVNFSADEGVTFGPECFGSPTQTGCSTSASGFSLTGQAAYNSAGVPYFDLGSSTGSGEFQIIPNAFTNSGFSEIDYTLTSLNEGVGVAPLPSSVWMMFSGLLVFFLSGLRSHIHHRLALLKRSLQGKHNPFRTAI